MTHQKEKQDEQKTAVSTFWWQTSAKEACAATSPQPGDLCPTCGQGILAYDGLFVLTCGKCGKAAEAGAFT